MSPLHEPDAAAFHGEGEVLRSAAHHVDHHDDLRGASAQQLVDRVASDETGPAGHERLRRR